MKQKGLVWVLLIGTLIAATAQVPNVSADACGSWSKTSSKDQITWINGVLSGVHYLAVVYAFEKKDLRILEFLPNEVPANRIQFLINQVYERKNLRTVPIVDVVIRFFYWEEYLRDEERSKNNL